MVKPYAYGPLVAYQCEGVRQHLRNAFLHDGNRGARRVVANVHKILFSTAWSVLSLRAWLHAKLRILHLL